MQSTPHCRPATIHRCIGTSQDFFCLDTNIVYWTSYHDINDTFTYASTNMGKHGTASFRFLVLLHGDFPNKLARKIHAEQCLALYSRRRTQQTHACFQLGLSAVQTSEPTRKTRGNTLLVLWLCNVLYRVSLYRDNCIRIRIVSWKSVSLQAYPHTSFLVDTGQTRVREGQTTDHRELLP